MPRAKAAKAKELESSELTSAQLAERAAAESDIPKASPPRRTITNWMSFVKAQVAPRKVRLWAYPEFHGRKEDTHARIVPTADTIIAKVADRASRGENTGFQIQLGQARQGWPGWAKIQDAGIEIQHIICEVCGKEVPIHPTHILRHLKPHKHRATGRISLRDVTGNFRMTLGSERSISESEAYLEDMPDFDLS